MEGNAIKRYETALNNLYYEGQISWQQNVVFIALNGGLISLVSDQLKTALGQFNGFLLFYAIIGLVINVLWLGTFLRNNKYYKFWAAMAREIEPKEWKLLNDRGLRFSRGEAITIGGDHLTPKEKIHKFSKFEKLVSNKLAIKTVIIMMIIIYLIVLVFSLHLI